MAKLFVVATPIGNLKDISERALEVLRTVDVVVAEDTRVTRALLSHYHIQTNLISFHKFSPQNTARKIARLLTEGNDIALTTDAGTPGISDPGAYLIKRVCAESLGVEVVPIPGASALSAMISVADIDCSQFTFAGFPPHKKGRKTFFEKVSKSDVPVILYESPHRIERTLKELYAAAGDRYCNIGRELTKMYEEIFRGKLSKAQEYFQGEKKRGEFVIVIQ